METQWFLCFCTCPAMYFYMTWYICYSRVFLILKSKSVNDIRHTDRFYIDDFRVGLIYVDIFSYMSSFWLSNIHVPGMCDVKKVFFQIFVSTILKKVCCIHDHISYKNLLYFDFTILKMVYFFPQGNTDSSLFLFDKCIY